MGVLFTGILSIYSLLFAGKRRTHNCGTTRLQDNLRILAVGEEEGEEKTTKNNTKFTDFRKGYIKQLKQLHKK